MWMKVCVAIFALVAYTESFPTGAPTSTCQHMTPGHGVEPQSSPAPYVITTSSKVVKAGEPITVTLSGKTPDNKIRGIMMQARVGDKIVGTFEVDPNDLVSTTMGCDAKGDTISHKAHDPADDPQTVTYKWTPPAHFNDDVKFRATVVVNFSVFWVGIESEPVQVIS